MEDEKQSNRNVQRRRILCGVCAIGIGMPGLSQAQDPDPASLQPPQENDLLVYAYGDKAGKVVSVTDLDVNMKQVFAWSLDPETKVIRNGTRLNQILLVRLDPATLNPTTLERSVDGVVAYSGVCSHTGCDVTDWNAQFNRFQCPCHESQYDPADGARVVGGPAPWQLAALPLKKIDGYVGVARKFEGRLGFQQPGLSPLGI